MLGIREFRSTLGAVLTGAMLSSCGGGGGQSAAPAAPAALATHGTAPLTVSITVPISRKGSAIKRKPQYVSPSTQSVSVVIGGTQVGTVNTGVGDASCTLNRTLTETATSTQPNQLAQTTDGSLWFGMQSGYSVEQVSFGNTPSSPITAYNSTYNPSYFDFIIATGADTDDSLWTGNLNTPSTASIGHVSGTNYSALPVGNLPNFGAATSFAHGAVAGEAYFTYENTTPLPQPGLGHVIGGAVDALAQGTFTGNPLRLKSGTDGRLWFIEDNGKVGYMQNDGTFTVHEYTPAGAGSFTYQPGIAVAPDNSLYFVQYSGTQPSIGHIDATGSPLSPISLPGVLNGAQITGLVVGPDGAIWIASISNGLFRVTTGGVSAGPYTMPLGGASPGIDDVAVGSDNQIYFTEYNSAYYGALSLSYTCSKNITGVPVGTENITVNTYDAPNAGGRLLGTSTQSRTISPNSPNIESFSINGVLNSVVIQGTPATVNGCGMPPTLANAALSVNGLDIDKNVIIGPGTFSDAHGNPLTVTIAGDANTSISKTIFTQSGSATANYSFPSAPLTSTITPRVTGGTFSGLVTPFIFSETALC